jgi:RNA polymerase sigma-70 factor, ECF subfamily
MRSSPVRTGFTAWVESLAREQTDGLVATAVREGLSGDDAVDAVEDALLAFLLLPQARALSEHRDDAAALLSVLVRTSARTAKRRLARVRPATVPPLAAPEEVPTVATLIAAAEQQLAAHGSCPKLSEIQRAVLRLRMLEEIATGEAGKNVGLSAARLAGELQHAKDALQLVIAE